MKLVARNPSVSPWCRVLLGGFPTIEGLYSISRRRRSQCSPGDPDRSHLHSLVATRLVQPRLAHWRPNFRNAAVSVLMWIGVLVTLVPALLFPTRSDLLLAAFVACGLAYHYVYRRVAQPPQAAAAPAPELSLADLAEAEEPRVISGRS